MAEVKRVVVDESTAGRYCAGGILFDTLDANKIPGCGNTPCKKCRFDAYHNGGVSQLGDILILHDNGTVTLERATP
jgi:hypothetical protein